MICEIKDKNEFNNILKSNDELIIGVIDESVISNLFVSSMKKVDFSLQKKKKIIIVRNELYDLKDNSKKLILPKICLYKGGKIVEELIGFKHYNQLLQELKEVNVC